MIISFDEFVIIAVGKYMMASNNSTVYTLGAAIGAIMNWAIAMIMVIFYKRWYLEMKPYINNTDAPLI